MNPAKEFSRFALTYQEYKIIQTKVASYLISEVKDRPKNILDFGAGTGEVYKYIDWEFDSFLAVDKSEEMLSLHPQNRVKKIVCDFNEKECFDKLKNEKFDFIFAASSLQWSKDLDFTLKEIAKFNKKCAFAIFTDKTFETIHKITGLDSPIYSLDEILYFINKYFLIDYKVKRYKLFFEDKLSMFRYIKKSGVSSGIRRLSYKETKELIYRYPYRYLEFEVVFIWTKL